MTVIFFKKVRSWQGYEEIVTLVQCYWECEMVQSPRKMVQCSSKIKNGIAK